uniref:glycosyltransferase n=1 Tax=Trichocoleus desertorum TaxID=1481672 RepID=UPI0025B55CD7|nr:glycosyltransferase [Trichocoleus desertorum]
MPKRVTVAIPTYKRGKLLIDALQSIIVQNVAFNFEILVLDNDCDKALEKKILKIEHPENICLKYIAVPDLGLHNGRNRAAVESNGEIVIFIDDDVITPSGWLEAMYAPFQDSQVGAVGGKTLPKWEVPPPDWLKSIPSDYFSLLDLGDTSREMHWPQTPYGCNMAFRRELILTLGGFPPDGVGDGWIEWKRGDGEIGFAKRVYDEGYKILYSSEAWLYHRIPEKRQTVGFIRRRAVKGAISEAYSEAKHSSPSRLSLLTQAAKHTAKAAIAALKQLAVTFRGVESWLKYDILWVHHSISAIYKIRLALDSDLRKWVYKQHYWTDSASAAIAQRLVKL